jgi:hypothetical protein
MILLVVTKTKMIEMMIRVPAVVVKGVARAEEGWTLIHLIVNNSRSNASVYSWHGHAARRYPSEKYSRERLGSYDHRLEPCKDQESMDEEYPQLRFFLGFE